MKGVHLRNFTKRGATEEEGTLTDFLKNNPETTQIEINGLLVVSTKPTNNEGNSKMFIMCVNNKRCSK